MAFVAGIPRLAAAGPQKILLRSSWQTVNIGDIAHTPGMLTLLEQHLPEAEITLWPNKLSPEVEKLLLFFLHGSGPGIVGVKELQRAKDAGKPVTFGPDATFAIDIRDDAAAAALAQTTQPGAA